MTPIDPLILEPARRLQDLLHLGEKDPISNDELRRYLIATLEKVASLERQVRDLRERVGEPS